MAIIRDEGLSPADGVLTPLAEAPDESGALRLLVPNDVDAPALAPIFPRAELLAVEFPSFADGRGFSLGRRLRDHGFRGRLRAHGKLIPDQFAYARACGFDEVEIDDDLLARQGEETWRAASQTAIPPFRRRKAA